MNKYIQRSQKISDFLEGGMTDDEVKAFDEELQKDPELADELAFVLATNRALLQFSDDDISEFEQSSKSHQRKRIIRIVAWVSSTAAVFCLFLWWFILKNINVFSNQERKQEIIAIVQANDANLRTAGGSTWKQDLLENRYHDASDKLKLELSKFSNQPCPADDLQFWYGLLLLCEQKQPSKAIPELKCAFKAGFQTEESAKLLIIAFLESNQLDSAQKLAQSYPEIVLKLPLRIQKRLNQ